MKNPSSGRTDMTELIVAIRILADASKEEAMRASKGSLAELACCRVVAATSSQGRRRPAVLGLAAVAQVHVVAVFTFVIVTRLCLFFYLFLRLFCLTF